MARYRAYVVLAVGVMLILFGVFESDSANWVRILQIAAGVVLLIDGGLSLGRASEARAR